MECHLVQAARVVMGQGADRSSAPGPIRVRATLFSASCCPRPSLSVLGKYQSQGTLLGSS